MKKRLVIFDWNGTLQDDVHLYFDFSVQRIFARHGVPCPSFDEYRAQITAGPDFMEFYWSRGIPRSVTIASVFTSSRELILAEGRGASLFPETRGVLIDLQSHGCISTIVSMAPTDEIESLLERHCMRSHFAIVTGDAVDGKHATLERHCAQFDIPPAAAIYVGDMTDDAVAAHATGVKPLVCPRGYHSRARINAARAAVPTMAIIESLYDVRTHVQE